VADTPLCQLDQEILRRVFPPPNQAGKAAAYLNGEAETPSMRSENADFERSGAAEKKWVLDLGCGTGRAAWALSEAGYDVLAIDLSVSMLEQLQAKAIPNVHPIQANLVELDGIESGVAEGAICLFSTYGMIQGREHRREMLRHVRRIVRREGTLLLHAHHRYASLTQAGGLKALLTSGWRAWTVKNCEFGDATYAYRGLPDMFLHRFSNRELMQDLQATGWRMSDTFRLSLDGVSVLPRTLASRLRVAGGFMIVAQSTPK